jgi:hypothetical protein
VSIADGPPVLAIDWSGARSREDKKIWIAEAFRAELVDLRGNLSREAVFAYLLDRSSKDGQLVVGLDFAFSAPAWFLEKYNLAAAADLWQLSVTESERWLMSRQPPFWGWPGSKRPELPAHLRLTDTLGKTGGVIPKSVFQVQGAGNVGAGSLRGWPFLHRLRGAGFSVWPFETARLPLLVEIYPRLLTGAVVKTSAIAREAYLRERFPVLAEPSLLLAASTDDAFDAAVSALVMSICASEFEALPPPDAVSVLEGAMWRPASVPWAPMSQSVVATI